MKLKTLLLSFFFTSVGFAQIPTNELVAWYQFNSTNPIVDQLTGVSLTQTGTAATFSTDRFGNNNALLLNGDVLDSADIPTTGSPDDGLTINFWIKTNSLSPNGEIIINDTNDDSIGAFADPNNISNSDSGYMIYIQNGTIKVKMLSRNGGNIYYPSSTHVSNVSVNDGEWHHVSVLLREYFNQIGTASSYQVGLLSKITIDNQITPSVQDNFPLLQSGTTTFLQSIHSTGTFHIGNKPTPSSGNYYTGEIDDLLVYDKALTDTELTQIVEDGNYCTIPEFDSLTSFTTVNSESSISFNFPESDTYDVAYHLSTETFSNAVFLYDLSNANGGATLSGLATSTEYIVYIRKKCINITAWSTSRSLRTNRPASTTRLYVNTNAMGANNGLSWTDAFTNLNDALVSALPDDEIWVAAGTYKPSTTNRDTYFSIDLANLKIYGGFVGIETSITQRVVEVNETILSGDLNGDDVNTADFVSSYSNATRNTDNAYHIINISSAGNNLLLDGLTISDAHNNLSPTERGGAIVKEKTVAELTLRNCIVKDNLGRNDNAGLVAEFELNNSTGMIGSLVIENCQFINNMSRWGSAVYSFIGDNTKVDISIANSLFRGNVAGDLSATVLGLSGSASWLRNIGNTASELNVVLANNTYVDNLDTGSNPVLNNITRATVGLTKNTTTAGSTVATVANCIFWDNETVGEITARSITDLYKSPLNSLTILNSIDESGFNDDSITNRVNTSNADPLFVNTSTSDYTLATNSPAIDTGDNTYNTNNTDLLGNQRVFNSTVDIGAYEYGAPTFVGRFLEITGTDGTITTNPNNPSGIYADGETVLLTAVPDASFQFDGWNGDAIGTTNPLSITMDSDKSITALFILASTASIVEDEFNNSISIYPNPIQNTLNVNLTKGDALKSIQVFNLLGEKVAETTLTQVNLSTVAKGIYMIKVENSKGKIAMRKIIKE